MLVCNLDGGHCCLVLNVVHESDGSLHEMSACGGICRGCVCLWSGLVACEQHTASLMEGNRVYKLLADGKEEGAMCSHTSAAAVWMLTCAHLWSSPCPAEASNEASKVNIHESCATP